MVLGWQSNETGYFLPNIIIVRKINLEFEARFEQNKTLRCNNEAFQKPKIIPKFATPNKILENSGVSTDSSENTTATAAKVIE